MFGKILLKVAKIRADVWAWRQHPPKLILSQVEEVCCILLFLTRKGLKENLLWELWVPNYLNFAEVNYNKALPLMACL
jgi:hypothetical protein